MNQSRNQIASPIIILVLSTEHPHYWISPYNFSYRWPWIVCIIVIIYFYVYGTMIHCLILAD
jgi:hypothetical protein